MSFILLRPKLLAVKNSLITRTLTSHQNARDLIILGLAISIMYMIYRGTLWAIVHINANPNLLYLPPRYPLSMILALLFFMLMISGVAISMGTLFMAQDLDLILATPISKLKIFSNKLAYIALNSCWMPLIFILPLLIAFGHAYSAPMNYYFLSLLILVPYFLLASSFSCLTAILLSKIIPANRSRELLVIVVIAILLLVYLVIDLVRLGFSSAEDTATITRLVSFLSLANYSFLPSSWAAACIQDFILDRHIEWPKYLPLLILSTLTLVSLAHIIFYIFHFDAYTSTRNIKAKSSYEHSKTKHLLGLFRGLLKPRERAMIEKELLNFSRDVTHVIQLVMLIGLCAIYIFNLRIFLNINSFPEEAREWWQKFFFVTNTSIAAFVTTGFCTRFVFVSLSLEGRSLWILQTSPLSYRDILNAKFKSWYLPVALLGCLVFCAAGLSLGIGWKILGLSTIASFSICYGIVGLAIGLGARFANYNWEHSSQLAAGFGNMIFMLMSIMLIAANLVPVCIVLFSRPEKYLPFSIENSRILSVLLMFICIFLLNLLIKHVAIRMGIRSMHKTLN